jgi:hypothetical protein
MAEFRINEPFEMDGFTLVARMESDDSHGAPWEEEDGHGPVSEWTTRDKSPGELVLAEDRSSKRYYDFAEAVRIAKRDGWDAPPYGGTVGEQAARAARADFEYLRRWCAGDLQYVGIVVSISKNGHMLDKHAASLWGIESESDAAFISETIADLAAEAVECGRNVVEAICDCA